MGFVAKSTAFIFSFLLFSWPCQVLADSQGHLPGIQGKTIEELIEMTEPEGEAAREVRDTLPVLPGFIRSSSARHHK